MSIFIGGNQNDTITGTSSCDLIDGGNGNDTINAGGGSDLVLAGNGNDVVNGGDGNDILMGENGNDTLNGGRGSDLVVGNNGNDILIFNASDVAGCGYDIYDGGHGTDRIVFELTTAQWANTSIRADILALLARIAAGNTCTFVLSSLNLAVSDIENVQIKVGGVVIDPFAPTNTVPVATNDAFSIDENGSLGAGSSVIGNDNTGTGAFTVTLASGPAAGVLSLNANGTFTYDPGTAFDYLAAGSTATTSFTYKITNSAGVSNIATASITITGTNDTPSVTGSFLGAVIEDDAGSASASGSISVTDADAGQSGVVATVIEGSYGTLTLQADGNWTYVLDNSKAATQALGEGVVANESFGVTSIDGTVLAPIEITVTGRNDAASAAGAFTGAATEDDANAASASGSISVTDADAGQSGVVAGVLNGTYGTLTLQANGNWTYVLDNSKAATQALGEGVVANESFGVTSVDGTVLSPIEINVTGTDDVPTVTGMFTGGVIEDDPNASSASGLISVIDADAGQSGVQAGVIEGTYGTFTQQADGNWSYVLDNSRAATQGLGAGVNANEAYSVVTVDGEFIGAVLITITGTNDVPTAVGTFSGAVMEDDAAAGTASGTIVVTDADYAQSGVVAGVIEGTYGTFTQQANGNWNYVLDNSRAATQALGAGVVGTESFGVTSIDGTELSPVEVTVTGTNDGPSMANFVGGTSSGPGSATAIYNFTDVDLLDTGHTASVAFTGASGSVAGLTLDAAELEALMSVLSVFKVSGTANGSLELNFSIVYTDFAYLAAGESVFLNYTLTLDDGDGGTSVTYIPTQIGGRNDAPTATGSFTGAVFEDDSNAASVSGVINVTDADYAQSGVVAGVRQGTYGTLTLQADGNWNYVLDNSKAGTQALGAGVVGTESFGVTSTDGTVLAPIQISVTGKNDEASGTGAFGGLVQLNNPSANFTTGKINVRDVDTGEAGVRPGVFEGIYGTLTLQADGNWSYVPDLNGAAIAALGGNSIDFDTFQIITTDGTEIYPIEILVAGRNDAPTVTGTFAGSVIEDNATAGTASGTITVTDIDTGESGLRTAVLNGAYGTLTTQANGNWTYVLDNNKAATQALGAGVGSTESFLVRTIDGTALSPIQISVTGTNDDPLIYGIFGGSVVEDDPNAAVTSGLISVIDVDAGESGVRPGVFEGIYGTLTVQADGNWTYVLDNNRAATQALGSNTGDSDIFGLVAIDGTVIDANLYDSIYINVAGRNDTPTVTGTFTGAVIEDDDAAIFTSGTISVSDVDLFQSGMSSGVINGMYGTLTMQTNGNWTYVLDNSRAATQALGAGVVGTESFSVTTIDGTAISPIQISVTGTNDAATGTGVFTGAVTEDDVNAAIATGTITLSDADTGEAHTVTYNQNGTYGSLSMREDGIWIYSLGNHRDATIALAAGDVVTESFAVTTLDGTVLPPVVISISGTNDGPRIFNIPTTNLVESTDASATAGVINVAFIDADLSDTGHTASVAYTGANEGAASLPLNAAALNAMMSVVLVSKDAGTANGSATLNFAATAADFGYLRPGERVSLNYLITIDDGDGGTDVRPFRVIITGTNDAATATGSFTGAVIEDDSNAASVSGVITVTDADFGQSGLFAVVLQGTYGTMTMQTNGNWNYVLDNSKAATQALSQGVVGTESFSVTTIDGTAISPIQISVTGTNDVPSVTGAFTGGVIEDDVNAAVATGAITVSDLEVGQSGVVATNQNATYGALIMRADGNWTYTLGTNRAATQALAAGVVVTESFAVTAADGTVLPPVVISILGTNDGPLLFSIPQTSIVEPTDNNAINRAINVTFTDIDLLDTGHTALVAYTGASEGAAGLPFDAAALNAMVSVASVSKAAGATNGSATLNFAATAADFGYLRPGERVNLNYSITIDDGDGGTAVRTFNVVITGTNDEPTATGSFTGAVIEDDSNAASVSGLISVIDADAGQSGLFAVVLQGTYGTLTMQGDGNWNYVLDNSKAATQALAEGVVGTESFAVRAIDGTVLDPIQITVTGTYDFNPIIALSEVRQPTDVRGFEIIGVESADVENVAGDMSIIGDVNGDGFDDFAYGGPNNATLGSAGGATYVVFGGIETGAVVSANNIEAGIGGFVVYGQGRSGGFVDGAGDVNGDGLDDIVIGATRAPGGLSGENGGAYVVYGKTSTTAVNLPTVQTGVGGFFISGSGQDVSVGDFNNDGFSDYLVGVGNLASAGTYMIYGDGTGGNRSVLSLPTNGSFKVVANAAGEFATNVEFVGDFNGDGIDDFVLGGRLHDANGVDSGASYVVFGGSGLTGVNLQDIINGIGGFVINGPKAGALLSQATGLGGGTSRAGDVNGDGLEDIIVAAPSENNGTGATPGAAYVIFGKTDTAAVNTATLGADGTGFRIVGDGARNISHVSNAGDMNGDGLDDLVLGSPLSLSSAGRVYVVYGKTDNAQVNLADIVAGNGGFVIQGDTVTTGVRRAGFRVDGGGDLNGDGFDDLIIGATSIDAEGGRSGFVVYGGLDIADTIILGTSGVDTGLGVAGIDEVIYAGAGNDVVTLDGNDIVTGGQGNDVFVLVSGSSVVRDFERGSDQIDVSGYGFTSMADLNITSSTSCTTITFNSGSPTLTDLVLEDVVSLSASDFIFA